VGPDGSRSMYTDRGANRRLDGDDLGAGLLDDIGHLQVSGYALIEPAARAGVLGLWRGAAAGLTVSVDPASVALLEAAGRDAFLEWSEGADLIFPNLDEGRVLAGADEPDEVTTRLLEHFPVVALKLGQDGAIVASRQGDRIRTSIPDGQPVVDSTGAGDAFCAGFLASWLAGQPLDRCTEAATGAASRAVHQLGARPVPTKGGPSPQQWRDLRRAAAEVAGNAYAPYSRLTVGAAGLTSSGDVVSACNVENASYGLTLCAECGLVSALHASGGGSLVAVSVVAGDGAPLVPCGRCRQLLLEAGGPGLLLDADGGPCELGSLLPSAFTGSDLAARRDAGA
jgi:cytidine deaminase